LVALLLGADDMERVVLEDAEPDAVAGGEAAVLAVPVVVDRCGGTGEPAPVEVAVDDCRDPPAGDRILAQLEQASAHAGTRFRSAAHSSGAAMAPANASANSAPARSTAAVVGGSAVRPSSSAIDVEIRPG